MPVAIRKTLLHIDSNRIAREVLEEYAKDNS